MAYKDLKPYIEMSKDAKAHGGPGKYFKYIEDNSRAEGMDIGRSIQRRKDAGLFVIIDIAGLAAAAAWRRWGRPMWDRRRAARVAACEERRALRERAEAAKRAVSEAIEAGEDPAPRPEED